MRRAILLVVAAAIITAGCGGGDADTDTCDGIADRFIETTQRYVDRVDDLTEDEIATLQGGIDMPGWATAFEEELKGFGVRAAEASCSFETMSELIDARLDGLAAQTEAGRYFISLTPETLGWYLGN